MVSVAFINPLSVEGRQVVREMGNLDSFREENGDIINVVIHTRSQDISDEESIPHNYLDLAVKRLEWYIKKRNDPNFDYNKYSFLFNYKITRFDVISFYLLCQAVGVKFGPNSRESRAMVESQGKLMESRLSEFSRIDREELIKKILDSLLNDERVKWTFFEDILSSHKLKLEDLVMDHGNIILNKEDFIESFSSKIQHRDPDKIYNMMIGDKVKELIMNRMIMQKTEDYIYKVHQKSRREIEPNPILLELAEKVSNVLSESFTSYGYKVGVNGEVKAAPLNPNAFPPCVKLVLEGMKSGGRNDAIILFFTPFVSYARLYPDVFRKNVTVKVSDVDPNLSVVQNEILPLVYGAAEQCTPPLFEDQPQEKVNINAKLGFGMHTTVDLKHEGESIWYTPMSCEKVKLHLPSLCKPDKTCKRIGNPLSYYIRKLWESGETNGDHEGNEE
jgi:DNA primase large subunit